MNLSLQSNERIPVGCEFYALLGSGQQRYPYVRACLILIATINILTLPCTIVLNALVMIAVKVKSRLRAHKSNILLAALASTDFIAGLVTQPVWIATLITILLDELQSSSRACSLQLLTRTSMSFLSNASLFHLALLSGERFLAIKHPFAYTTLVTTPRLLAASALAWLLSAILHILMVFDQAAFLVAHSTSIILTLAFIIFCHVTVFCEARRHEQQLATQQVTQEARRKFKREKKAFKLTLLILAVLFLCYLPLVLFRIIFAKYLNEASKETRYIVGNFAGLMVLLNSLLNPVIYSVRIRPFRIAFFELICKTVNSAET